MATEILRPNAAGDETALYPNGDTYDWQCVDEASPDDDTTWVCPQTIAGFPRDLYNLPASSIPVENVINFIKIYFRCIRVRDPGYAKPVLKSDSTVTEGTPVALTTGWITYSEQWNTNPAGGDWEVADINALQIGIALDSREAYYGSKCTQVYVEIDHSIPPPVVGRSLGFIIG